MSDILSNPFTTFLLGIAGASLAAYFLTRRCEKFACHSQDESSVKLISVRRIGERIGRPIVASGWNDIVSVFAAGKNNRIFFPNGDEILPSDRTQKYFDLLPSQQLLYVAPNGEDFNPIDVFEHLDEQRIQSQNEVYSKLLDATFQKCIPPFTQSEFYGKENGLHDFVKYCVEKYIDVSKTANTAFFS